MTAARNGGHGLRQTPSANNQAHDTPSQPAGHSATGWTVGLVPDEGAAAFFDVSKRTFGTFMDADWMPRPILLGPRLRRWSIDELRAAVANMPRQTERSQPESLLRTRIERLKSTGVPA